MEANFSNVPKLITMISGVWHLTEYEHNLIQISES